jgi:hypothetical protein
MKTLIITLFAALSMQAQTELTPRKLIGTWKSVEESATFVFSVGKDGGLTVKATSDTSQKELSVLDVLLNRYILSVDTMFVPTQWSVRTKFIMVNATTLVGLMSGDSEVELVFKKQKEEEQKL